MITLRRWQLMSDTTSTPAHSSEHNVEQAARTAFVARHPEGFNGTQWQEFRAGWDARHEQNRGRTHTAQPTVNVEEARESAVDDLMRQEGWNGHHRHTIPKSFLDKYRERVDAGERAIAALATPPTPQSPDRSAEVTALITEALKLCQKDFGLTYPVVNRVREKLEAAVAALEGSSQR